MSGDINTDVLLAWARSRRWFYRFPLPGGEWTAAPNEILDGLHESRRTMMQRALRARFGDTLKSRTSIDLACHQGYFSIALAELTQRVTGLDMNAESLADAARIMEVMEIGNVQLQHGDVQEIDTSKIEPADVVLMYGLIYHIEDPLRLLRRAAGWCKDTLLIETQLTPFELETRIEWGSHGHFRDVLGLYALVDDQENPEGGITALALVPSVRALDAFLRRIGFSHVEVLPPPDNRAEQLVRGRRAVIAAYR